MKNASLAIGSRTQVPLIVMLTDFGLTDPFAGIMKGVIASIAPGTQIVDLTHEIPAGDIHRGAVTLWQSSPYFPEGTIFLGVIDPGVGTSRRPVLVESSGQIFIGPDNGLFSYIVGNDYQAWELRAQKFALPSTGRTFHGRDVFAPAAAHAANGIPGRKFGPPAVPLTFLTPPELKLQPPKAWQGEILFADRFGNLLTSLGKFETEEEGSFQLHPWINNVGIRVVPEARELRFRPEDYELALPGGISISWVSTFAEAPPSGCAFLVGSSGLIEIVSYQKSAAQVSGLRTGDHVILRSRGDY